MNTSNKTLTSTRYNKYRQCIVSITATIVQATKEAGEKEIEITVEFKPGMPTYGDIVNAIISRIYPNPDMQAIQNNYLLDPEDPVAKDEFDAMQKVRAQAKSIAKNALQSLTA